METGNQVDPNLLLLLTEHFDYEAALEATAEDARQCLKVIKHYVLVEEGSENIDQKVKVFLNLFGIEPEYPYHVVGGFDFVMTLLRNIHDCKGRACVLKHKNKKTKPKSKARPKAKGPNVKSKAGAKTKPVKAKKKKSTVRRASGKEDDEDEDPEDVVVKKEYPIHYL